jgi:putative transposase
MAKRVKYRLTEDEVGILEQAIRHDERPEVRQRATAIRMLHLGKHPGEVAEVLAVRLPSIYNWHARWRAGGLEGLANRPKSGRPGIADEAYCQVLAETLDKSPAELGYSFTVWTVKRLRDHLKKETGKELSESRLRHLLQEQGYRYRRPKHDLHHLQDPEAKEQARQLLEELKRGSEETISSSSLWTKRP